MAKRKKYYFNPDSTKFEEVKVKSLHRILRAVVHLLTGIIFGAIFFLFFVSYVRSPKEKELRQELNAIEGQYKALQTELQQMQIVMSDLQSRDDNLYRNVFQAKPIPITARHTPAPNTDFYNNLYKKTNSKIVVETTKKAKELKKQLYVQSKSYDEIILLAQSREKMLEAIPAIQPISNKDLKRLASGYGYRYDPIYHTRRFHKGMDFSAPKGTDIYVTGNGTVSEAGWIRGYGNCVKVNHGFGYLTLYGHMSEIKVKKGQKVVRGEVIGLVGNTGKSTGPHLHYEVHLHGKIKNPANYYFMDLTPEEYDNMIQMAENSGQMMD